jgi:hypothetical protein
MICYYRGLLTPPSAFRAKHHLNLWHFVAYDIRAHEIILSFKTQLDAKYELCGKTLFFPFKGLTFGAQK